MILKNNLKTVRFNQTELSQLNYYLASQSDYKSVSDLFRVALWEFISPHRISERKKRPSFLWEYDLSALEIREILHGPQHKRLWLVGKILEHAKWEEVWEYLSLAQIAEDLPKLRINPKRKAHWEFALSVWKHSDDKTYQQ